MKELIARLRELEAKASLSGTQIGEVMQSISKLLDYIEKLEQENKRIKAQQEAGFVTPYTQAALVRLGAENENLKQENKKLKVVAKDAKSLVECYRTHGLAIPLALSKSLKASGV